MALIVFAELVSHEDISPLNGPENKPEKSVTEETFHSRMGPYGFTVALHAHSPNIGDAWRH